LILDDLSGVRTGAPETWPARFRAYLRGRGVSDAQVEKWSLGYFDAGAFAERVYVPIEDATGLRSYAARSILPEHNVPPPFPPEVSRARWTYSYVPDFLRDAVWFGQRFWPAHGGVAVVVEGVFDALRLDRDFPGLSVAAFHYMSQPQAAYDLLAYGFDRVVVLTDSDPVGDRTAEIVSVGLRNSGAPVVSSRARLPRSKDPASADLGELRDALGTCGVV